MPSLLALNGLTTATATACSHTARQDLAPLRWLVVLAPLIAMVMANQAIATPRLRVLSRERLDRPHLWRVVIAAKQPRSMEGATASAPARPLGTFTFRVNCETGWLRDVTGGTPRPPKPLEQLRGYPTGVPQEAFASACGETALSEHGPRRQRLANLSSRSLLSFPKECVAEKIIRAKRKTMYAYCEMPRVEAIQYTVAMLNQRKRFNSWP